MTGMTWVRHCLRANINAIGGRIVHRSHEVLTLWPAFARSAWAACPHPGLSRAARRLEAGDRKAEGGRSFSPAVSEMSWKLSSASRRDTVCVLQ
jgi:hypothetical protein